MYFLRHCTVIAGLVLATSAAFASEPPARSQGVQALLADSNGRAQVTRDSATGHARFIRLPAGSLRQSQGAGKQNAEGRAAEFFADYGSAFGVKNPQAELKAAGLLRGGMGTEHAIFDQTHGNIPVFGGQLRAHFNSGGQMFAANGTFVADIKVNTTPKLSANAAMQHALDHVEGGGNSLYKQPRPPVPNRESGDTAPASVSELSVESNTLMIYREGLLRGVPGADHLVYEVEVRNKSVTLREFVYVDAHTGKVVDQISGIHSVLDRQVSEATIGNVVWSEGDAFPTGTLDWDNEIDGAGETYNLIASMTAGAYLSYDAASATMRTINNAPISCPNASWNGVTTNYCDGVTSDDIVAHEWGHAYTEYTNNLIYAWQPGALNESYSDIWGEVVDFLNGRGSDVPGGLRTDGSCSTLGVGAPSVDTSYRWLTGEDSTGFGGAIRDMWNPECYGDPGKVTSSQYYCSTGDSGGVHSNSGVPNHGFALLVDGGNYNGVSVAGIGLTKAAHIHWSAQILLTPSSNFADHADALETSCASLTGIDLPALSTTVTNAGLSGEVIDAGDCAEVTAAIAAVEFRTEPSACGFTPLLDPGAPELCADTGSVQSYFSEDFEGGTLPTGWVATAHSIANPATFDNPGWSVEGSLPDGNGSSFAAFAPDLLDAGNCANDTEAGAVALDSPEIVLPVDEWPRIAFDHWVATEFDWDGGNLKLSVNGGAYELVPASAYSFNPYNWTLRPSDNPLTGEEVFTGSDGGQVDGSWGQSQVDLLGLAFPGDTVKLRFDLGFDGCNGRIGWYVDDVQGYSCSAEALPVCGDAQVEQGEQCDDGNASDGDGCSSACQIESGWSCATPSDNGIADGSFEAGPNGGIWNESSTNYGTPICDVAACGTGTGTGPSDGSFWAWFGGSSVAEEGSVSQVVTIPAEATTLSYDLEQIQCDSDADYVELLVDGATVDSFNGASALCGNLGYTSMSVDISPWADGGLHTIEFHSQTFANNGGGSNFFVDNVVLGSGPSPSVCTPIVEDLACNAGSVGFDDGIGAGWSVLDNEGNGVIWTDIETSGEAGNYTGGTGEAASVSSDAFGVAEFNTELISAPFSLQFATSAALDYLANYQNFGDRDFLDLGISTDGGSNWTTLLSWNEDHGVFRSAPGETVSVDLSSYLGEPEVRVRWHYYDPQTGDYDWYAQVDNVALDCATGAPCDIDLNGVVEQDDVDLIMASRNQPAEPGLDPRDNDGNGIINVADARQCALMCATPGCVGTPPPSVCGDGVVGPGEQCDDGNVLSGDGCSSSCQTEIIPGC